MNLTMNEITIILAALREKYGPGYADKKEIAHLQAKLSIMHEVERRKKERDESDEFIDRYRWGW